jgi:hypothetical protein
MADWEHVRDHGYLADEVKDELRRGAAERGVSEAELIREFIDAGLASSAPRWDLLPMIHSPELAQVDYESDLP